MKKAQELNVKGTPVRVLRVGEEDFICLTDMAAGRGDDVRAADVIKNWLRARYTLEFLGTWEQLHNPAFKVVEFDHFKAQAGLPSFTLSVSEWIESTNAVGLIVKNGRYGGTYAQKDIAFEFGSAISVLFKLYLIDEFQRLKAAEQAQLGWSAKRELAKINYRIHTDAIQQHLIPAAVTRAQMNIIYANEADVLNVALFGQTHQQWQVAHPDLKGNQRDYADIQRDYADINQLICISNMENLNAVMIQDGVPQPDRLKRLNEIAIHQMRILSSGGGRNLLK